MVRFPDMKLDQDSIHSAVTDTIDECIVTCIKNPECISLNTELRSGSYKCYLLKTHRFKRPEKLISSSTFTHFSLNVSSVKTIDKKVVPQQENDVVLTL